LQEVREQTAGAKVSPPPADNPRAAEPGGEDAAKKAVDAAKAKRDRVRRKRELVQTQKELLDRVTTALEACRSAAVASQNAVDDLRPYALECVLRVKDGSLAEDKVPGTLNPGFLAKKKRQLRDDLAGLKAKSADVQKGEAAVARLLGEANKAALA